MSETGQKIISAVRKRATGNPKFIYEPVVTQGYYGMIKSCVYVKDGRESCLIGAGLWDNGLIDAGLESLQEYGDEGAILNEGPLANLLAYLDVEVDYNEQRWLQTVQSRQDMGYRWADAVRYADELFPEVSQ